MKGKKEESKQSQTSEYQPLRSTSCILVHGCAGDACCYGLETLGLGKHLYPKAVRRSLTTCNQRHEKYYHAKRKWKWTGHVLRQEDVVQLLRTLNADRRLVDPKKTGYYKGYRWSPRTRYRAVKKKIGERQEIKYLCWLGILHKYWPRWRWLLEIPSGCLRLPFVFGSDISGQMYKPEWEVRWPIFSFL